MMSPPPDHEIKSAEKNEKSGKGWKVAGLVGLSAVVGYLGSGIRESLSFANFFSEGARESKTLKNGEEIKIFGATAKLDGWTLKIDTSGTQEFLKENPSSRDIRFRILNESGGDEILITGDPGDYEDIPPIFRSQARDFSNIAKTLGYQGLQDPHPGHAGVVKQDIVLKPEYGSSAILLVEEEIQNNKDPDHPEVRRTMIALNVEKKEYENDNGIGTIVSEHPLSEKALTNIKNFVSKLRKLIDREGEEVLSDIENIEVSNLDHVVFEGGTIGTVCLPSNLVEDEKRLTDLIPEVLHKYLISEVKIDITKDETAKALLKLHKFVDRKQVMMEWGGDWWGIIREPKAFHKCILFPMYYQDVKSDDSGVYIDSPEFFVSSLEAIARLYPEEFKKRYFSLLPTEREAINNFVHEVVEPLYGNRWGRPLKAPMLLRDFNRKD